jgi:HEAT repeat protein
LTAALSDPHWLVAATAADALGRIGAAAATSVPALAEALRHPDWTVRRSAATALGNLPEVDTSTLKAIEERSRYDTSPEVRGACNAALHQCRARLVRSAKAKSAPLLPPGPVKRMLF